MTSESKKGYCEICGEKMPEGEEMFRFHGYSGNCPSPPIQRKKVWDWVFYDPASDIECIIKYGWTEEEVIIYIDRLRVIGDGSWPLQRKIEETERDEIK